MTQSPPVIAIGLESASPALLEKWMAEGYLENLAELRRRGAYGHLENVEYHGTETEWTTFLTGCLPEKTGYWRPLRFKPSTYQLDRIGAFDFVRQQPFYALGPDYRVAAFDLPQTTLSPNVNGAQVMAWGAHDPQTERRSHPPELLPDLRATYGDHPAFNKAFGDNWWDADYQQSLEYALKAGISRRAAIARDLLKQEPWDLFVTIFGETHSAGHNFWHLSQDDHPLNQYADKAGFSHDPLRETFQSIDRAIGEILKDAPENANIVIFNALGMGPNYNELPSMFFLGEVLFRLSFPGEQAFSYSAPGTPLGPVVNPENADNWGEAIWARKHKPQRLREALRKCAPRRVRPILDRLLVKLESKLGPHKPGLIPPYRLAARGDRFWQIPTSWYRNYWPRMQAFALPSYSDGLIRINLIGREASGKVAPSDYEAVCASITRSLHELKDARTQAPIVKKVIRTRNSAFDDNPNHPDADLVVIWHEPPTDVIESHTVGRIGPAPYRRSGGHANDGCLFAVGPDIEPGSTFQTAHAADIAPTLLALMGAPQKAEFDGKPISLARQKSRLAAV